MLVHTGLQALRRYFELIVFQWYLQSSQPDTIGEFETMETFVKNRPGTSPMHCFLSYQVG